MRRRPAERKGPGARNEAGGPPASLARALSKMGFASRAEAGRLIEAGRVTVDGEVVRDPARRVSPGREAIAVDGVTVRPVAKEYVAFHKPRGLVTTARDEKGRPTVYDALGREGGWLAPVGRLDKASEGLLLFTNDTGWGQRLLDRSSHVPRTYHVQVGRHLDGPELERLRTGVVLDDGRRTSPARARVLRAGPKNCWVEMTLDEGLNRQIRRMMDALGAEVLRLVRVAIGPVRLGGLARGRSRPLTSEERRAVERLLTEGCRRRPTRARDQRREESLRLRPRDGVGNGA